MTRRTSHTIDDPFVRWLEDMIARTGIQWKVLAARAEVAQSTISMIRTGKNGYSKDMVIKLASALYTGDPSDTSSLSRLVSEALHAAYNVPPSINSERYQRALELLDRVESAPDNERRAIEHLLNLNINNSNISYKNWKRAEGKPSIEAQRQDAEPAQSPGDIELSSQAEEILRDIATDPDFAPLSELELRKVARSMAYIVQSKLLAERP